MLYKVRTKIRSNMVKSISYREPKYHMFIASAKDEKTIKQNFKASWPTHKIIEIIEQPDIINITI